MSPSTPEEYRTARVANIDKVLQTPLLLRWIRPESLRELQAERQSIVTESADEAARRFVIYQSQPQEK